MHRETSECSLLATASVSNCAGRNEKNNVVKRGLRLLLLALSLCVVWLTVENRWGSDFQLPSVYGRGDVLYVLGMMKLAKDGDLGLFTHITTDSLGAPFKGQLNDFVQTERVIIWLGGYLARVIGLMPAVNTMLILFGIVAAWSFYSAARLWGVSRFAAWSFAIVYAFLPHTQRSISNLGIIFTGLLPLQFYVLWYIATAQKLSWRSSRFRLTLIVSLLSGILNIYWIALFLQLYVLSLGCRLIRRRQDFIRALIPFSFTCLTALAFLGSFILYRINYGRNPMALVRTYLDIELWSLKPIDLLIPNWGAHLDISSGFFSRYYDGGRIKIGEYWWGAYIGFFAIIGLLILFLKGIQRQINKRSPALPYLATLWIIAYSSFGGGNSIFSLLVNFYDIRCTNRYSVAIATIGMLYFAFLINRLIRKYSWGVKAIFLSSLSLLGILDQSFSIYNQAYNYSPPSVINKSVKEDKALALKLESILREDSMIYMLPVLDFPEPSQVKKIGDFEFYLYGSMVPFLYSTNLRYSYGSHKGRQGSDWQFDVEKLPPAEMAAKLESYGFSGILLNRKCYEDRAEQLLAELAESGWPMEFEQGIDNEWVFIRLTPAENPVLPTLTPYALTREQEGANSDRINYWAKSVEL